MVRFVCKLARFDHLRFAAPVAFWVEVQLWCLIVRQSSLTGFCPSIVHGLWRTGWSAGMSGVLVTVQVFGESSNLAVPLLPCWEIRRRAHKAPGPLVISLTPRTAWRGACVAVLCVHSGRVANGLFDEFCAVFPPAAWWRSATVSDLVAEGDLFEVPDCVPTSEAFASFLRQRGISAAVVQGSDPVCDDGLVVFHCWTVASGVAFDWTVRQFFNVSDATVASLALTCPVPLVWPAAIAHPLLGFRTQMAT